MTRLFTNNASAILVVDVSSSDTTLVVGSGQGSKFPNPSALDYAILTLTQAGSTETAWEEVKLTGVSGDSLTVVRAQEGSTNVPWASGDKVELRITAELLNEAGTKHVPQNSQSANYTCVLSDRGCHILHPTADTAARTFTIPSNGSVAYPIGTALTFINQHGAGVVTIALTTDTMRQAATGALGSRSLAADGIATAIKLTATEWIISGVGLS